MKFHSIPVAELHGGHITEKDGQLLSQLAKTDFAAALVAEFDTGWFVQVGKHEQDPIDGMEALNTIRAQYVDLGLSPAFMGILDAAQREGLEFLRIHADAEPNKELTVFDW